MADKINAEKNLQEFKSIGMTQVQISSRKVEKKNHKMSLKEMVQEGVSAI